MLVSNPISLAIMQIRTHGLSIDDVSVYVSAQFLLLQYPGKRSDQVYSTSQDAVTNLWPYLLMREEELRVLRSEYSKSFLVKILPDALSARLWTNPDDPRQVRMAMRYLTTFLMFPV